MKLTLVSSLESWTPFILRKKSNQLFHEKKIYFLSKNFLPAIALSNYQKHGLPKFKKTNFGFIFFAFINEVRNLEGRLETDSVLLWETTQSGKQ